MLNKRAYGPVLLQGDIMGQYYNLVTIARKKNPHYKDSRDAEIYAQRTLRILSPSDYNDTLKLFEIAYFNGEFSKIVASQAVRTHKNWLPPRMAVIGDYAEIADAPQDTSGNTETPTYDEEAASMILNRTMWADRFRYTKGVDRIRSPAAWIALNHDKKEYVRLDVCKAGKWTRADPLILLLAVGNGRGGGDYSGEYIDDVGAWAFDHIEVINECEPIPDGYKQVYPMFAFE